MENQAWLTLVEEMDTLTSELHMPENSSDSRTSRLSRNPPLQICQDSALEELHCCTDRHPFPQTHLPEFLREDQASCRETAARAFSANEANLSLLQVSSIPLQTDTPDISSCKPTMPQYSKPGWDLTSSKVALSEYSINSMDLLSSSKSGVREQLGNGMDKNPTIAVTEKTATNQSVESNNAMDLSEYTLKSFNTTDLKPVAIEGMLEPINLAASKMELSEYTIDISHLDTPSQTKERTNTRYLKTKDFPNQRSFGLFQDGTCDKAAALKMIAAEKGKHFETECVVDTPLSYQKNNRSWKTCQSQWNQVPQLSINRNFSQCSIKSEEKLSELQGPAGAPPMEILSAPDRLVVAEAEAIAIADSPDEKNAPPDISQSIIPTQQSTSPTMSSCSELHNGFSSQLCGMGTNKNLQLYASLEHVTTKRGSDFEEVPANLKLLVKNVPSSISNCCSSKAYSSSNPSNRDQNMVTSKEESMGNSQFSLLKNIDTKADNSVTSAYEGFDQERRSYLSAKEQKLLGDGAQQKVSKKNCLEKRNGVADKDSKNENVLSSKCTSDLGKRSVFTLKTVSNQTGISNFHQKDKECTHQEELLRTEKVGIQSGLSADLEVGSTGFVSLDSKTKTDLESPACFFSEDQDATAKSRTPNSSQDSDVLGQQVEHILKRTAYLDPTSGVPVSAQVYKDDRGLNYKRLHSDLLNIQKRLEQMDTQNDNQKFSDVLDENGDSEQKLSQMTVGKFSEQVTRQPHAILADSTGKNKFNELCLLYSQSSASHFPELQDENYNNNKEIATDNDGDSVTADEVDAGLSSTGKNPYISEDFPAGVIETVTAPNIYIGNSLWTKKPSAADQRNNDGDYVELSSSTVTNIPKEYNNHPELIDDLAIRVSRILSAPANLIMNSDKRAFHKSIQGCPRISPTHRPNDHQQLINQASLHPNVLFSRENLALAGLAQGEILKPIRKEASAPATNNSCSFKEIPDSSLTSLKSSDTVLSGNATHTTALLDSAGLSDTRADSVKNLIQQDVPVLEVTATTNCMGKQVASRNYMPKKAFSNANCRLQNSPSFKDENVRLKLDWSLLCALNNSDNISPLSASAPATARTPFKVPEVTKSLHLHQMCSALDMNMNTEEIPVDEKEVTASNEVYLTEMESSRLKGISSSSAVHLEDALCSNTGNHSLRKSFSAPDTSAGNRIFGVNNFSSIAGAPDWQVLQKYNQYLSPTDPFSVCLDRIWEPELSASRQDGEKRTQEFYPLSPCSTKDDESYFFLKGVTPKLVKSGAEVQRLSSQINLFPQGSQKPKEKESISKKPELDTIFSSGEEVSPLSNHSLASTKPSPDSGNPTPSVTSDISPAESETGMSKRMRTKLRPYKPPGSEQMFYTESENDFVGSAPASITSVESAHTGSDDAVGPNIPREFFGSRRDELPVDCVGIYGTRKHHVKKLDKTITTMQKKSDEVSKKICGKRSAGSSMSHAEDTLQPSTGSKTHYRFCDVDELHKHQTKFNCPVTTSSEELENVPNDRQQSKKVNPPATDFPRMKDNKTIEDKVNSQLECNRCRSISSFCHQEYLVSEDVSSRCQAARPIAGVDVSPVSSKCTIQTAATAGSTCRSPSNNTCGTYRSSDENQGNGSLIDNHALEQPSVFTGNPTSDENRNVETLFNDISHNLVNKMLTTQVANMRHSGLYSCKNESQTTALPVRSIAHMDSKPANLSSALDISKNVVSNRYISLKENGASVLPIRGQLSKEGTLQMEENVYGRHPSKSKMRNVLTKKQHDVPEHRGSNPHDRTVNADLGGKTPLFSSRYAVSEDEEEANSGNVYQYSPVTSTVTSASCAALDFRSSHQSPTANVSGNTCTLTSCHQDQVNKSTETLTNMLRQKNSLPAPSLDNLWRHFQLQNSSDNDSSLDSARVDKLLDLLKDPSRHLIRYSLEDCDEKRRKLRMGEYQQLPQSCYGSVESQSSLREMINLSNNMAEQQTSGDMLYSIPEDDDGRHLNHISSQMQDIIDPFMEKLKEKINKQREKCMKSHRKELARENKLRKLIHLLLSKQNQPSLRNNELESVSITTTLSSDSSSVTVISESLSDDTSSISSDHIAVKKTKNIPTSRGSCSAKKNSSDEIKSLSTQVNQLSTAILKVLGALTVQQEASKEPSFPLVKQEGNGSMKNSKVTKLRHASTMFPSPQVSLKSACSVNSASVQTTPQLNQDGNCTNSPELLHLPDVHDKKQHKQGFQQKTAAVRIEDANVISVPFMHTPKKARSPRKNAENRRPKQKLPSTEKVSTAWFYALKDARPRRTVLREIQPFQLKQMDQQKKSKKGRNFGVYKTIPYTNERAKSNTPLSSTDTSLQDAFQIYMQSWISRSKERQKRILLAAEERRRQYNMDLEREKLFQSEQQKANVLVMYPVVENLHKPKKRSISKKDRKQLNEKIYKKLPEVMQKQQQEELRQFYKQNRLKERFFSKNSPVKKTAKNYLVCHRAVCLAVQIDMADVSDITILSPDLKNTLTILEKLQKIILQKAADVRP